MQSLYIVCCFFSPLPRYGGLLSSSPGIVDGSSGPYSPGPNFGSGPPGSDSVMGLAVGQKRPAAAASGMSGGGGGRAKKACSQQDKMHHIKKPLNAFMLYMKEMRPKIVAECTLKESAAINQILGRRVSRLSEFVMPKLRLRD